MEGYIVYSDKLKGDYKDVFNTVNTYVETSMVDEVTESEALNDLCDMLLTAQEEGRPAASIVGNNIETFCRNFCAEFSFKERLLNVWDFFKKIMLIEFWLSLGDMLFSSDDILTAKSLSNTTGYMLWVIVVSVVVAVMNIGLSHLMFKSKKKGYKIANAVSCVVAVALFVIGIIVFDGDYFNFFPDMPAYIPTVISAVFLAIYYAFNRKRREIYKQNKVSFWEASSEMDEAAFAAVMEKKRLRKHMKPEEFFKKETRETEKIEMIGKYSWVMIGVVYIACIVVEIPSMESFVDGLLFSLFMAVIFFFTNRMFVKINKGSVKTRKKWEDNYMAKNECDTDEQ